QQKKHRDAHCERMFPREPVSRAARQDERGWIGGQQVAFAEIQPAGDCGPPVHRQKYQQRRETVRCTPKTLPPVSEAMCVAPCCGASQTEQGKYRQRRLDRPAVRKEGPPTLDAVSAVEKADESARAIEHMSQPEQVRFR